MSGSSSKRKSLRRKRSSRTTTPDSSSADSSPRSSPDLSENESGDDDPWAAIQRQIAATQIDDDEIDDAGEDFWADIERQITGTPPNRRSRDDDTNEETADETIEAATRAIMEELDALSRVEAGPSRREGQPETSTPEDGEEADAAEEAEDVEGAGTLTLNKRDLLTDSGSEAPFGAPTSSAIELVEHPRFHASVNTPAPARTPIYRRRPNGELGDAEEKQLGYGDFMWHRIGQPVPVRGPNGVPMVASKSTLDDGDYLIGRDALVEKTYQKTVDAIDATEKRHDADHSEFWTRMLATLKELPEVTVPSQLSAFPKTAVDQRKLRNARPVPVPPGTYPKTGILDRRMESGQFSPFSLAITVGTQEVVINPDLVVSDLIPSRDSNTPEGNTPQVVDALQRAVSESGGEKARAARLTAEQIVTLFTGSATFQQYVTLPADPGWLRDEHVHYVTQDEMGALLVLNRMPDNPGEIEKARSDDRFATSDTTNGTQIDDHIYIKENRTGIGTEYHETVHRLSSPAVLAVLGFWFNEGLTEHFTQLLLEGGTLVRNKNQYGEQHQAITALMEYAGVTETELADAYFRGELQPLYDRVARTAVHPPFSRSAPFSLDGYAARVDEKRSAAARETLRVACTAPTQDDSDDVTTTIATDITDITDDTADETGQGEEQADDQDDEQNDDQGNEQDDEGDEGDEGDDKH
ncbi:hypothetical protein [Streptosporangium sp. NPDC002524]|uniref:hypothetical protein n=1 Tax=Streptosporangium sp. NPDC002524 TaxID=3154537 RepID=UPI00332D88B1